MTAATAALPLRADTLARIGETVPVPAYDRAALTTGIVHLGVGGFHRAHEAMYLDEWMNTDPAAAEQGWGICGVGVLAGDERMKRVLDEQDGLYTLVLKHPDGSWTARVVGSLVDYLWAPEDPEAVLERMADPATRIVSLTVTEGGYSIHPVTGEFDVTPAVQADLAPGAVPATAFGLVVEALARRRERGIPAFTVLSCDNIQGNGDVAARSFRAFAELRDPDLAGWIAEHVRFPNSMVDRITPATTDDDRAEIARRFGILDGWPVVCEPWVQWVLQDEFGDQGDAPARPAWESVGVQFVAEVEPYEKMKLRLLNASHQAMSYLGRLAGYDLVSQVCRDPAFAAFLLAYMSEEATPTLDPVPGIDLDAYRHSLIERFGNEGVRDTLARNCAETSDRIPTFILPVVRDRLAAGGDVTACATVIASWVRYLGGVDENGRPLEIVDRNAATLVPLAAAEDPTAFLRQDLFGGLADEPRFTEPYLWALQSLRTRGARATAAAVAERGARG
ncbi:mannitol dehydrogenase family protein [Nakamurella flavida]|uniref:Mannitol-1-phosphate 5-dehydrogenase n=1 Tax=Nakamurella flavida TaxID=363630 RepID=A0A939C1V3_9ACTN|nr:mannitol dehydrogenase family protein [Nakamurella flavida]MBM9475396.1 mannitol dehydrogenase family protein [Nakamurella flavida]MDP9776976.1 mannitol 2-dehydrogenase [Nakamurella flavida]